MPHNEGRGYKKDTDKLYAAIDIGTHSVRAAIFTSSGRKLVYAAKAIELRRYEERHEEASSSQIWEATCAAMRGCVAELERDAGGIRNRIVGLGVDATCSLVANRGDGSPVSVGKDGDSKWNIILWRDHRAVGETNEINQRGQGGEGESIGKVLQHYGGGFSPENEPGKLLWLRRNLKELHGGGESADDDKIVVYRDLTDWLTWKCTGSNKRSVCTVSAKWGFLNGVNGGWEKGFWKEIGLSDLEEDLLIEGCGSGVGGVGERVGMLSKTAARELGLSQNVCVGVGVIDAYAGGIGILGANGCGIEEVAPTIEQRVALVCGTSTCFMASSREAKFVPGVWGPFLDAMIPGLWVNEGGQSATGSLLDDVIERHYGSEDVKCEAALLRLNPYEFVEKKLKKYQHELGSAEDASDVAADLHILPDFHGNRSPRADPNLTGSIVGLRSPQDPVRDLCITFMAIIQAISYGARHIMSTLQENGHDIRALVVCGGITKGHLFVRELADATGIPVYLPEEDDSVLLGGAVLAASAENKDKDLQSFMKDMNTMKKCIEPNMQRKKLYHDRKYKVFLEMHEDSRKYKRIMQGAGNR